MHIIQALSTLYNYTQFENWGAWQSNPFHFMMTLCLHQFASNQILQCCLAVACS